MMFSIENALAFTIEGPVDAESLLHVTDVILDSHPVLYGTGGKRRAAYRYPHRRRMEKYVCHCRQQAADLL